MSTLVAQLTIGSYFAATRRLAVGPVERVREAVPIEVYEQLSRRPADALVDEDHFVNAVVVPFVVRRHLVHPPGHSCIDIAREDGHRPFVVSRPLTRIPRSGIGGAVVYEVELGI